MKKISKTISFSFLFIIILMFLQILTGIATNSILSLPRGIDIIAQAFMSVFTLVILLLFGNSYVFKQEKEKTRKGLFYGLFFIITLILITIANSKGFSYIPSVINLLIFSFLVGLSEELLCRGFLLNELLEKFGQTKKGIWFSIVFSGFLFGIIHITNVLGGEQDLISTIIQVISATSAGMAFGIIYFKTKNIWSLIILHALWDFAIFLGDLVPTMEIFEKVVVTSPLVYLSSILMFVANLTVVMPFVKNIDEEPKKKKIVIWSIVGVLLVFAAGIIGNIDAKQGQKHVFYEKEIKDFSITTVYKEKHLVSNENATISLSFKDFELTLKNEKTNYSKKLDVKNLNNYTVVEKESSCIIAFTNSVDGNYYLNYYEINKVDLNDNNELIDSIEKRFNKHLLKNSGTQLNALKDENNKLYLHIVDYDYNNYILDDNKLYILK